MPQWNSELDAVEKLRAALVRLADAAEVLSADQSYAKDSRCGLVQPITVQEGQELNDAITDARKLLGNG